MTTWVGTVTMPAALCDDPPARRAFGPYRRAVDDGRAHAAAAGVQLAPFPSRVTATLDVTGSWVLVRAEWDTEP